jgi:Fur family ferric uptake transcriptional regulator
MEKDELKEILRKHQLRITNSRLDIIEFFMQERKALSQGNLEERFHEYDRVTLYRTLNSFLESGILHKIPNDNGVATYGLCYETCSPDHHDHNHIHFKCNECGQIECLDAPLKTAYSLPEGYRAEHIDLVINGICARCN